MAIYNILKRCYSWLRWRNNWFLYLQYFLTRRQICSPTNIENILVIVLEKRLMKEWGFSRVAHIHYHSCSLHICARVTKPSLTARVSSWFARDCFHWGEFVVYYVISYSLSCGITCNPRFGVVGRMFAVCSWEENTHEGKVYLSLEPQRRRPVFLA